MAKDWRHTNFYQTDLPQGREHRIISVNAGTHSLRVKLFKVFPGFDPTALASAEALNLQIGDAVLTYQSRGPSQEQQLDDGVRHEDALRTILDLLRRDKRLAAFEVSDEFLGVCHRVPHGGDYEKPQIITTEDPHLIHELRSLSLVYNDLALRVIEESLKLMPKFKHAAHFDTSFHKTIPKDRDGYMIDPEVAKYLRKSGAHGISYSYATRKAYETLAKNEADKTHKPRLIIFHLGNVSSGCTIYDGKSLDSSSGPLSSGLPGAYASGIVGADFPLCLSKHYGNENGGDMSMRFPDVCSQSFTVGEIHAS